MNTKIIKSILYLTILIFLLSCSNKKRDNIIMFSSTSLKNPLTKICNNYKAETNVYLIHQED